MYFYENESLKIALVLMFSPSCCCLSQCVICVCVQEKLVGGEIKLLSYTVIDNMSFFFFILSAASDVRSTSQKR